MKINYLTIFSAILLVLLIITSQPFVTVAFLPNVVRVPLLIFTTSLFLIMAYKRRIFINSFVPLLMFFLAESIYWFVFCGGLFRDIFFFIFYAILAFSIYSVAGSLKGLKSIVSKCYLTLIIVMSVLAIAASICFNFTLVTFTFGKVGSDLASYRNFYYPVLGYINLKDFGPTFIGRVCGYLFEPSYIGGFLTINFFLMPSLVRKKKSRIPLMILVFLGAMSTFSTMVWVVFPLVIALQIAYWSLRKMKIRGKLANGFIVSFIIFSLVGSMLFINKESLLESLGPSSSEDREGRMDTSFTLLVQSDPLSFLAGRGAGYIESHSDKGESNQFVKMLVENGFIVTVLFTFLIIACTYRSKYFMFALLLFLNSAVFLFTPLIIINILVCKWLDDEKLLQT